MSRVVRLERRRATSALPSALALVLLATAAWTAPSAAQDVPPCEGQPPVDCVLPDWSVSEARDIDSPFGAVDGIVWSTDERGEAPDGGLDILGVGLGRIDISDPGSIRRSDELLKLGGSKKAVREGPATLIRVVLDRPIDQISEGHSGIHIATDVDGSRSNNAPSAVGAADNPFVGMQDIYSLTYAATTGESTLLKSDLAKGWYKTKGPYAAMWAAPNVLDVMVSPQEFGDDFRVVTFVDGPEGGYDRADAGSFPIPSSGRVGLVASCVEASISTQPFTVRRLVENGQTVSDVEAPASWRAGATFGVEDADRDALRTLIDRAAEETSGTGESSGTGETALASTVSLFEDGVVIRQRPDVRLGLDGDRATLSLELGLTRRGYNVLRDIEMQSTGDAVVDAWLSRASDALTESMPPFRVGKKAGLVVGEAIGGCIPSLSRRAEPRATPVALPSSTPPADAAAQDA